MPPDFRRVVFSVRLAAGLSILAFTLGPLGAAPPADRRAKRPEFPHSTLETFFPDAREKLKGERPGPRSAVVEKTQPALATPAASIASGAWSKLISPEVLEDEIKARVPKLAAAVENPTRFKSGEFQTARRELGILAAMLGIVAEYDGRVRWQAEAASLRDQLGRASSNCKVASDAALSDARARAEDLQLLVRGSSQAPTSKLVESQWPQIADRTLIMQRLEEAQQQLIAPGTANEKSFADSSATLHHEAEIVAALAEIITRNGYEFADDETYVDYAKLMQQQAASLRSATLDGSFERARSSATEIGQSCTACHEGYRS